MYIFFEYLILQAYAFSTKQQTFICTNDSQIHIGSSKMMDQTQISNNPIFSYITTIQFNMTSYEQIQCTKIQNNPILILRLKDSLEILFFQIILEISDEEQPRSEIFINQKKKLQISSCQQIIKIYSLEQYLVVVCEQEDAFIFYFFNNQAISNVIFPEAQLTQKLDKICNCQVEIGHDLINDIILISMQNCTNWAVFILDIKGINIIFEPSQFNQEILKAISVNQNKYLIFNHQVYIVYDLKRKLANMIYENFDNAILYYYSFFLNVQLNLLILTGESNQLHEFINDTLITYETQIPNYISFEGNYLFLQFDKYLNLFSFNEDSLHQSNLMFDNLFSTYPYIFGVLGETIQVYKVIKPYPYVDCNNISTQGQFNNLFVKFVNYDYQQLQQSYLFSQKYFFSISDAEQLFSIQNILAHSSIHPYFQIESNEVECKEEEYQTIQDCNIEKLACLWTQYIYVSKKLFIVFQSKKQKLYIQDCENQNQIYLGQIETISLKNVYIIHKYVMLLHSEGKKVTILNSETFPNIHLKQYQFNDKAEVIFSHKTNLYVIFSSCYIYQLDLNKLFLFEKFQFQTNIFQQCNKFTTYINRNLLKFNSNQLILITSNLIKKISFGKKEEIKNIIIIEQSYNQFIMLIKQNKENVFIKYSIYEDEAIKNFNLPTYMYHYTNPIKYQHNQKYLIVAATKYQIENRYYLLVYAMNNEKYNILIDIIENIEVENFQIAKDDTLLFYKQKQLHFHLIGKVIISCKILKPLVEYRKNIKLQVLMKSKIFEYQQSKGEILINLQNFVTKLQKRNYSELELERQIKLQFLDARYFVSGPISYISSQDYDIYSPLKLIANKQKLQCSQIIKHLCIDTNNKIIKDYFHNIILFKLVDFQTIQVENDYIVIQNILNEHKIIQIYSMRFETLFEIELEYYNLNFQVKIFSQFLFLISTEKILIYYMNKSLSLLKEISQNFGMCQITQLKQKENIFLISTDFFPFKHLRQLEILGEEVEITFYELVDSNYTDSNFVLFIVSFEMEDTYFRSKVLLFDYESSCYILDLRFYYEEKILKIGDPISIVRLHDVGTYYQFHFFSENLFSFANQKGEIYLYNISNSKDFQFIDSIYLISSQKYNLQIFNSTHFLLQKEDLQNVLIYELQPYTVGPIFQNKTMTSIIISNSISQIELKIETIPSETKMINQTVYFITGIIIISFLILLLNRSLKSYRRKNFKIEQKEIEI